MSLNVIKYSLFIILSLLIVPFAFAESGQNFGTDNNVLRFDDSVRVDRDQLVETNFYGLGKTVTVSGDVFGDFLGFASDKVSLNGNVSGDILAIGRNVQVSGSTTDDVRVAAVEVELSDYVGGSAAIFADTVKVLSSAQIEGDLIIFANNLELRGQVNGNIIGRVTEARIDGVVGKNIDITTNSLVLGGRTDVAGDIIYESPNELVRAQDAEVGGSILYTASSSENTFNRLESTGFIIFMFSIAFAGLCIFLLAPNMTTRQVYAAKAEISYIGMIGILVILLGLPISIALIISGLGTVIGIVVFSLYVLVLAYGFITGVLLVGFLVSKYIFGRKNFDVIAILLGAISAYMVLLVPFVGELVLVVVAAIGVGAVSKGMYRFLRM